MPIRTLVVDDSSFFRRQVVRSLEGVKGVEVVGVASNGRIALAKILAQPVDVVVLDVCMPEMDGLETLRALRGAGSSVRVIMLSGHSRRAAENTVAALCLGAEDFIAKPTGSDDTLELLRERLRRSILRQGPPVRREEAPLCNSGPPLVRSEAPVPAARPPAPRHETALASHRLKPCEALVIGASTGGPRALSTLFSGLPRLDCPILVVQHMPTLFTASLARQLSAAGPIPCREAEDGELVERGLAYMAPGGRHLEVEPSPRGRVLRVHDGPPVHHCRPSVDVLFRSAASAYGPRCLGLILTGMGNDGLEGSRALTEAGAEVWAQDRDGCVVWGMPRAVTEAGLASSVLPLEEIPQALSDRLPVRLSRY